MTSYHGVFELDWEYTEMCIKDSQHLIDPLGTFINPNVPDEGNNWGSREPLLSDYRKLVDYIETHN